MQQLWRLFLFGFGLFEAGPLVQLPQLFLLSNKTNPDPSSDCTCLELAPGAAAQEWMNVSHLAEKVLSMCLFLFFSCVFLTDPHAALVDLQGLCAVSCVAHSMNWRIKKFLFHHFCSAFSRNIDVMCYFRCACVKYISEIPLCIFNTCLCPFFFPFISRIPLRATIVPKAS